MAETIQFENLTYGFENHSYVAELEAQGYVLNRNPFEFERIVVGVDLSSSANSNPADEYGITKSNHDKLDHKYGENCWIPIGLTKIVQGQPQDYNYVAIMFKPQL